jgi:hypothetical protein
MWLAGTLIYTIFTAMLLENKNYILQIGLIFIKYYPSVYSDNLKTNQKNL